MIIIGGGAGIRSVDALRVEGQLPADVSWRLRA